jgi:hypothetical protein
MFGLSVAIVEQSEGMGEEEGRCGTSGETAIMPPP